MYSSQKKFKFSLLVLSILASQSGSADDNQSSRILDPITVMATKGSDLQDLDMSTTIIQHEQIQNAPQTTVDQIINKIPGVFAPARLSTQIHPTGQLFNIRGFGTSTNGLTLILVDGIPANDPYFRTMNWSQIPKEQVERIEVIRGGGATSLWGNMAMGGVINIVTRQPQQGTEAYVSFGSFNTWQYGISQGFKVSDKLKIGLNYDGSRSDGYWTVPEEYRHPQMSKTSAEVDVFNFNAIYTPNTFDTYQLNLQGSETKEEGLQYKDAQNQWKNYRIALQANKRLNPNWDLNTLAWYQANQMNTQNVSNAGYSLANPKVGIVNISQKEFAKYETLGFSSSFNGQWSLFDDLKIGADYRQVDVKDPLKIFNSNGTLGNITAEARHEFIGLFVQGLYRAESLPLDVTLGLRQDFWQASKAKTYGEYQGNIINNPLMDQDESHFSPRLGVKYQLNNQVDLRAVAYKNFSAPGLNQMYRSFISGSNYTIPNTDLSSQTNQGFEMGIDWEYQDLNVSVNYFHNKVKDYIDYATVRTDCSVSNEYCNTGVSAAKNLRQYVNAGDAKMQGVELIADWDVNDRLNINAGYTYTQAELTRSELSPTVAPTDQQLGQIPTWIATLGASWQVNDKLNVNLQLRQFNDYWNNTAHTQLNQGALTADLSANYQVTSQLQLFAIAQNISDETYYDQGMSYLADGTLNTSSSGSIPQYAQPLSMTVGAKYRF